MNPSYNNSICKILFQEEWYSYDFAQPRGITPYASRREWNNTFITTINRLYAKLAFETESNIPISKDFCAILSDMSICDTLGNQFYYNKSDEMFNVANVGDIELYPIGKLRGFLDIILTSQRIFKKGRGLILEKNNMKGLPDEFLLLWCKKSKKGGIINIRNE